MKRRIDAAPTALQLEAIALPRVDAFDVVNSLRSTCHARGPTPGRKWGPVGLERTLGICLQGPGVWSLTAAKRQERGKCAGWLPRASRAATPTLLDAGFDLIGSGMSSPTARRMAATAASREQTKGGDVQLDFTGFGCVVAVEAEPPDPESRR